MTDTQQALQRGARLMGCEVKRVTPLPELRSVAYELEHVRSGARLLHLHNDDAENLFSISVPTPPPDDTGLPHILEHAVLGGSRKFPVRDPFFEMMKMSMATFLNAMTGEDCTYYPVASNVKQDLFNLADVYFDAVFHPLLTEGTFKQEGHHLAPVDSEDPTGPMTISGIVYNEMKGAFSDPESRLLRFAARALFPDTIYGRESAGDPQCIPDLKFQDFRRFHEAHYHPRNALFFLYGNIPTSEYLAFLEDRLDAFERRPGAAAVERQPRWREPRTLEETYPVGRDEPCSEKTYLLLEWLTGDATDPLHVVCLEILSLVLLGNEAAPLKKAIVDSKLGHDLFCSGYGQMGCETTFRVALKGSEADRAEAFTTLVRDTLAHLAADEMDPRSVAAAFRQSTFHYLEVLPMFPLHVMDRALDGWLRGGDPLAFLRMNETLGDCRRRYEEDPKLFNRLIRALLLDNPHSVRMILRPDPEWGVRSEAAFRERMTKTRNSLSDEAVRRTAAEAGELRRLAGTPNPPELVAKLPQLRIGDLPGKPRHIPTSIEESAGVTLLRNDVFSNGVNYLQLDLDLQGLPAELWPYLHRYTDSLVKLGAAGMDYEQMARRSAENTGGIGATVMFRTHLRGPEKSCWSLGIGMKALDERMAQALDVLGDLVFGLDPRDSGRLRDVTTQTLTHYRSHLVYEGSQTAALHAGRGLSCEGHLAEVVGGLPQLALSERLSEDFDLLAEDLMDKIEAIRDFLLAQGRLTVSFTGSDSAADELHRALTQWTPRMRQGHVRKEAFEFQPYQGPPCEGLAAPIQVAHCALVMPGPHASHPDEPFVALGCRLLQLDHLLSEIRFKGGAYGAMCRYNPLASHVALGSYRDPHVARTLRIFSGIKDYVSHTQWSPADIERAIIGTAKNDELPIRPGGATNVALQRHLIGQTPESRERRYARLLGATADDVKLALLETLEANLAHGAVCVVASREALETANREMPDRKLAIEDILK